MQIASGSSSISGTATVGQEEGQPVISVEVEADQLSLPAVLALTSGGAKPTASPDVITGGSAVWTDRPFDFSGFEERGVRATIRTANLDLGSDAALKDARLQFTATGKGVQVETLEGEAAGGRVTFSGSLERRPAGAELTVSGAGRGLGVHALDATSEGGTENAPDGADGNLDFRITLKGRGLSPRGIVSVMEGEGEVRTRRLRLPRFSAQLVHDVAADVSEADAEVRTDDLKSRLTNRLGDRPLDIGERTISLRIRDGALQADELNISTRAAAIKATTFVDLGRLRLDSEWRVTPKAVGGGPALPPVTVLYAGDIRRLSEISPGFAVSALERELAVRRLEGNIDRLEGLRSLKIRKRKKSEAAPAQTTGAIRPTIGGENASGSIDPALPKSKRRDFEAGSWQPEIEKPPVELRLQIPKGANPT
ncbi:MAG: AsmA-like C-terminal region-containing protein [Hyphomicrobiaceae bacterium]